MRRNLLFLAAAFVPLFLSGCRVGPDYQRPAVETPADWHWKKAALLDAAQNGSPATPWQVFKDPTLDQLESLALEANQDIRAAVARVDEARAQARLARSDFYP